MRLLFLFIFSLAAGCTQSGTISISLVFPPGTTRLPATAATARLTLIDPPNAPNVQEGPIAADGSFDVAVQVDATGDAAQVTFEALDAGGAIVARGLSPAVPLGAFDEPINLFVAPPSSFAAAPVALRTAVADVGVALLGYGVLFAGGRDASGQRSANVDVYSIVTQTIVSGAGLPAPRAAVTAIAGPFNVVYLFGGFGAGDAPVADFLAFDTEVAPAGSYTTETTNAALARTGARAAPLGGNQFLITGSPLVILDGTMGSVTAFGAATSVPAGAEQATTAGTTVDASGNVIVFLAGPGGVFRYDATAGAFTAVSGAAARTEQSEIVLASGAVLIIGGRDATSGAMLASADQIAPDGTVTAIPALLAHARRQAAVSVAQATLVVAGGFDDAGAALGDAETFGTDGAIPAPIADVPLVVPRGGATAVQLPNSTVVLVGGRASDPSGAPTATIEIFTP